MTAKKKPRKTRRGRGEGAVNQRPDGSWQGQLSVGSRPDGSRNRVFVNAPTKHECLDLLAAERTKQRTGTLIGPDVVTVKEFLVRWIEYLRSINKDGATVDSYERNIKTWINPTIGSVKVQKLESGHVEQLINKITSTKSKSGKARSPRLAQYNRTILRLALKRAKKLRIVTENVTDLVDAPASNPPEMITWNEEQTNKALDECENERLGAITAIGLMTGMRQAEILALHWADIDFKYRRIHVRRTQTTVNYQIVLKPPKTKAGRRTIEFSERLEKILLSHKARMMREGWLKQPFVFVDLAGVMLDRFGDVKSHFRRIIAVTKNPVMGFHCTRHTHATLLFRADTNAKVVQERLGHSTVHVTLSIYAHVIPAMQSQAVANLDRLLG